MSLTYNHIQHEVRSTNCGSPAQTRNWFILALLCTAQFVAVLDRSIVNVALPSIQRSLGFSPANLQWVVTAYALTFGGLLMLAGRAADIFGRRRFFMVGVGLFSFASLAGGLSQTEIVLIGARAVQGVGAAMLAPATLSLLTTTFREGVERNRALGIWGAASSAGASAGVLLGGALTGWLGWEWVFFVNVPVGVAMLLVSVVLLPPDERPKEPGRIDIAGAISITAGLMLLVYALSQIEQPGVGPGLTATLLLAAVALVASFVAIESRARTPLIPLRLLRLRAVVTANLVALAGSAVTVGVAYFSSIYTQRVLGYSPLATGMSFLPNTLAVTLGANIGARLIERTGARLMMMGGMGFMAAGALLLCGLGTTTDYLSDLMPAFVLTGMGMGMTFVTATIAATTGLSNSEQGIGSGLFNTSRQVGSALGLALLVSVFVSGGGGVQAPGTIVPAEMIEGVRWAFVATTAIAVCGGLAALSLPSKVRAKVSNGR